MCKSKQMKKLLALALACILAVEAVPLSANAEKNSSDEPVDIRTISPNRYPTEEPVVVKEEVSKREEYVKHFRMSDGTYVAAQYLEPVHFLQNGSWTDYDNTLEEVEMTEEPDMSEEEVSQVENGVSSKKNTKDMEFKNKTSDIDIRLAKKTNGKKVVQMEKDGYKISWYYKDAQKTEGTYVANESDEDKMTLEKTTSQVIYEDVFSGVDLEYVVGTTGLKENLILKNVNAGTTFEAEYKANGLEPVMVDSHTIELRNEAGQVIYTL